jgi:hypothetical protein
MREFSISTGGVSVAGATTCIFVNPAAAVNPNLEFLRYWVGQSANATSAQQRIQLETQVTAFPTLTGATPTKLKPSDPNASVITSGTAGAAGTAGTNASAEGAGAKTAVWDDAFNVLNGWLHVPTPAETRVMPASSASGLGLYFPVAPATLTNWAFGLVFREV